MYVPQTQFDKILPKKVLVQRTDETRKKLSALFGGYTDVKSTGGFTLKNGELVQEPINKVTSFSTNKDYKENRYDNMQARRARIFNKFNKKDKRNYN